MIHRWPFMRYAVIRLDLDAVVPLQAAEMSYFAAP
jgi:hypothetical protein